MSTTAVQSEIAALEERLKQAELGPDPEFFQEHLDERAVMVTEGKAQFMKEMVVNAHKPGAGPKFTRVEMSDVQIVDHGIAAVVICTGLYETAGGAHNLRFTRTWVKKPEGWRIVAGTVDNLA